MPYEWDLPPRPLAMRRRTSAFVAAAFVTVTIGSLAMLITDLHPALCIVAAGIGATLSISDGG